MLENVERKEIFKVAYPRLQCPVCKSYDVMTVGTKWPTRNHQCKACFQRFMSVDAGPPPGGKMSAE